MNYRNIQLSVLMCIVGVVSALQAAQQQKNSNMFNSALVSDTELVERELKLHPDHTQALRLVIQCMIDFDPQRAVYGGGVYPVHKALHTLLLEHRHRIEQYKVESDKLRAEKQKSVLNRLFKNPACY